MTEIRFTRDYRGKLTQEQYYVAGTVISLDHGVATAIVAEDAAEFVIKEEPEPKPEPKKSSKAKAN